MASEGKLVSSDMKVSIQSQKCIKPATPTPPHLHNHQLSSIDQLVYPFVQLIFHFNIGNETAADEVEKTSEILARLEESLSKILTLYYPFAGRYNNEYESTVSCLDQGVDFVVAFVDRKLYELVDGGAHHKKVLLCSVDKLRSNSGVAWIPVVLVQVNVFTCGGLSIGLGFNHKVGDMFTISTFMHAWATVARLGTLDQVVRPSFNISSLLPPRDFHLPTLPNSDKPPPNFVTKRYIFTGEAIAKLKAVVNSEHGLNHTRVELVTALITKSLINIGCTKRRPFTMSHAMNLRSRTALPIEENSCGNMITIVITAIENEEEALELRELAGFVQSSIRNVASEIEKVMDPAELSRKVENASMVFNEEIKKGDFVIFSSWVRFPLYEVDFGWGRPSIVRALPGPGICIWLMDHRSDSGGIEAWVQLEEDDMARFQYETDIIAYTSS